MDLNLNQGVRGDVLEAREDGVTDYVAPDGSLYRSQDVTDILQQNAEERTETDRLKGFRFAPDFRHVARIPVAAVDIAKAQGLDILNDRGALLKFLSDPANKAFLTSTERLSWQI